jgi:hypothetical protein
MKRGTLQARFPLWQDFSHYNLTTPHRECLLSGIASVGFIDRLDRQKPTGSKRRGPPAMVHNILNTVIGLSHLRSHYGQAFRIIT